MCGFEMSDKKVILNRICFLSFLFCRTSKCDVAVQFSIRQSVSMSSLYSDRRSVQVHFSQTKIPSFMKHDINYLE